MPQLLPLLLLALLVARPEDSPVAAPPVPASPAPASPIPAAELSFTDLLAPGPKLAPSPKVTALAGRRVRLVGFMAELEDPPRGAFYLTARPVRCDEGGAGTGDLPLDAVRVVVRSATGEEIPFYPGAIEVTGLLDLGTQADPDGRPSYFRITLDRSTNPNGGQVP
jgi:hypothetical protein